MDNFNSGKIKEMVYDVLQNPTRENFIDILDNGLGEQDNLDFKVQWIEAQKLAEILLGIANSGGGAIILGVKENEDGTLESIGLSKIEDKEKIHSKCEFPYKSRVMGTSEPLKPLKAPYMARNPVKWGFFRLKGQEIPLKI